LPTFNLLCNIFRFGHPVFGPVDNVCFGNLTPNRRASRDVPKLSPPSPWYPGMTLLVPYGTDIRGESDTGGFPDTIEVPAGSSRFYVVQFADYVALGFPNQHMFAVLQQKSPFPPGPPAPGDLLLEDGTDLLLEDGTAYLLE
jgi:hypothetical protein